jgi:hypothetical protein
MRGAHKSHILAVTSEGKFLFLKLDTDYRIILKCIVRKQTLISGLLFAIDSPYKARVLKNEYVDPL